MTKKTAVWATAGLTAALVTITGYQWFALTMARYSVWGRIGGMLRRQAVNASTMNALLEESRLPGNLTGHVDEIGSSTDDPEVVASYLFQGADDSIYAVTISGTVVMYLCGLAIVWSNRDQSDDQSSGTRPAPDHGPSSEIH